MKNSMKDDLAHGNQPNSGAPIHTLGLPNLIHLLRRRAEEHQDKTVYTYLKDGELQEAGLTYYELERRALAIAAHLQALVSPGERVLLFYPPGIEFPTAFFGCLCAGMVAVPTYLPYSNRFLASLDATVSDARPTVALTTASTLEEFRRQIDLIPGLKALTWIPTDSIPDDLATTWKEPPIGADSLAVIQYTSGSTGSPKGIMVSHGNLLHNSFVIHAAFGHSPGSRGVVWLPPYHDMGLVGGIVGTVYAGMDTILISPVHFIQKPLRWLTAISRYKATTSGGPNFAYDLCVRKITPEQKSGLDLSSWEVAFNGADPTILRADGQALKIGRLAQVAEGREHDIKLVGNGGAPPGHEIVIVDPEKQTLCKGEEIGEIWISGPSVAQGYWNRPGDSGQTFRARLADKGEGSFLRTGDLGFIHAGQPFVTGRLKDLII